MSFTYWFVYDGKKNNWSGYLRANEKWAEALGEKFLGLSCGLVPTRGKKRKEDSAFIEGNEKRAKKHEQDNTDVWNRIP